MTPRPPPRGDLVFSDQHGRICPRCGVPAASCSCRPGKPSKREKAARPAAPPPSDGIVRVSRETKGRKGKGVTLVTGLPLSGDELAALGKALKKRCGAGGTVKDGVIEVQGDRRDVLVAELEARGYRVKRAGG